MSGQLKLMYVSSCIVNSILNAIIRKVAMQSTMSRPDGSREFNRTNQSSIARWRTCHLLAPRNMTRESRAIHMMLAWGEKFDHDVLPVTSREIFNEYRYNQCVFHDGRYLIGKLSHNWRGTYRYGSSDFSPTSTIIRAFTRGQALFLYAIRRATYSRTIGHVYICFLDERPCRGWANDMLIEQRQHYNNSK